MPVLKRVLAVAGLGLVTLVVTGAPSASAHPMPHSIVALDVGEHSITANLQIPVDDLSIASGIDLTGDSAASAIGERGDDLNEYLIEHLRPYSEDGAAWAAAVGPIALSRAEQTGSGAYREITAQVVLTPPAGESLQQFTFHLDPVIHQVVTHTILVTVREGGSIREIGTVRVDTKTMTVSPLVIDLENHSAWTGFGDMVRLGSHHILEGTDHLLFLLVLLLPAPMMASTGRWAGSAGARTALGRVTRITLAFTIGHSATLAISALNRVQIPTRPIEALIAVSVLIGAAHAVRPLFPGREPLVAAGFGLIHGTAFSFTLAGMNLTTGQLILSLLGFNLGIEAMQLLVVALVLPSLIMLSRSPWYRPLRTIGAAIAGLAAGGWLLDRIGVANAVARTADRLGTQGWWFITALAVLAVASRLSRRRFTPATTHRAAPRQEVAP
ncbi:HupE/UreJ family protein [Kineosporia sp. NBRC 101731]|uniref:HupE/UreJ family protein n=1 Tax=Kineosporia sp. NBRC 101731 TaxID=3032199 RepID=UPI0024A133AD|nr:HupE/UreJ family protein [Kineosporia sp. NBRC 101731]GLY28806.1 membrane protein [Kineosporia sp. NBRC 101731]